MRTTYAGPRRPDIDWLRVLAVLLLVPYHAARIFNVAKRMPTSK
jgi:peptidoglycan/LPS O-acetylase OafA/YrhL